MASMTILTLHGKGLKLDTRADIEPYLKDVDPTIIEEIHFGGNTIGVDASEALAELISKTTVLKVSFIPPLPLLSRAHQCPRSPTSQISSPGA